MRILIYDNNPNDLQKFSEMMHLYPLDFIIDKVSDLDDALYMFEKHNYDKVFIDFNDAIGKKLVSKIIEINPEQKMFLLNDEYECIKSPIDCEDCKKRYNKEMIIKPLMQSQLTRILSKNFICENFELSEKEFMLERVKKAVHKKYPYLKFDYCKERDSFISDNIPTSALVFITDLLSLYEIEYHVSHKNQIIIN